MATDSAYDSERRQACVLGQACVHGQALLARCDILGFQGQQRTPHSGKPCFIMQPLIFKASGIHAGRKKDHSLFSAGADISGLSLSFTLSQDDY